MANELPEADVYQVVARDVNGEVASQGRVPAERIDKARRLFEAEGWTVEITPITE